MATLGPRPISRWELAQLFLLIGNGAWTTFCLGGYRPETMLVTSVLFALSLAVHFTARIFPSPHIFPLHWAGWIFVPFVAYAALNVRFITPVRWLGWRDWWGWCLLLGTFWIALNDIRSGPGRRALFWAWIIIGAVSVAAAGYQHYFDPHWLMLGRHQAPQFLGRSSGTFGIPNSLGALLILFIPSLFLICLTENLGKRLRVVAAGCAGFFLFGIFLTISRGAWLALGAALLLAPLSYGPWGWPFRWRAFAAVAVGLVLVGAVATALSPRVRQRLAEFRADAGEHSRAILWKAAGKIWCEHPVLGSGGGSFNVAFEKFRPEGFRDNPEWAHSDYLNTLSDYGIIGFTLLFGAAAIVVLAVAFGHRTVDDAGGDAKGKMTWGFGLAVGLMAFGFHLAVDFHWKIPALALASATCAALAAGEFMPVPVVHRSSGRVARIVAGICGAAAIAAGCWWGRIYQAEAIRRTAVETLESLTDMGSMDLPTLVAVEKNLERAVRLDPANAEAWSDWSGAQSLHAYLPRADLSAIGRRAEDSALRALKLSEAVAEFWWRRGVAVDLQGRWSDAGTFFAGALLRSPNSARVWYYYAYHQSLNPAGIDLARSALDTCLRLDPENAAGLALRQRLAITPGR